MGLQLWPVQTASKKMQMHRIVKERFISIVFAIKLMTLTTVPKHHRVVATEYAAGGSTKNTTSRSGRIRTKQKKDKGASRSSMVVIIMISLGWSLITVHVQRYNIWR